MVEFFRFSVFIVFTISLIRAQGTFSQHTQQGPTFPDFSQLTNNFGYGGNPSSPSNQQPQFWNLQPQGIQRQLFNVQAQASQIQQAVRKSLDELFGELFRPESGDPFSTQPGINLPDLSHISGACPNNSFFYSMNPNHMGAIQNVKNIIMSYNTTTDRISISNALRHSKEIHPKVWYYALAGCSVHDAGLQAVHKPSPVQVMPDVFINADVFRRASNYLQNKQQGLQPGQQQGLQPGQQQGFQPGLQQGFQPGLQQGFQPGLQQGFHPGLRQGFQPGTNPEFQPGLHQGSQPGTNQGFQQPGTDQEISHPTFQSSQNYFPRYRRQSQQCILLDGSVGADNGPENALWYFREDIQLNSHHWYWHLTYSPSSPIRADRRGELFYYIHSNILARYNAERLSNGLAQAIIFPVAQGSNIAQGYFAHLADSTTGLSWTDRTANVPFTDIIHQNDPNLGVNIIVRDQILTASSRIQTAIDQGFIRTNFGQTSLINIQGIDILGDIIQSSIYSLNSNFYGLGPVGLHNSGHVCFAEAMDPQYNTQIPPGPMADTATSMRDIIFYNWHTYINGILDRHKSRLTPYTPSGGDFPLLWNGVQVVSVTVQPWNGGNANQLQTFWNQLQFPFTRGLDFQRNPSSTPINICATYLDHGEFTYQILLDKQTNVPTTRATVRIFLAPRFDLQGNRFSMMRQRTMFFALDIFTTTLNPGRNRILRNSTDSTLTIPWQQTIQESNQDSNQTTPFCGCGWPHHLLLPKGTPAGALYDLVIVVTNGDQDFVVQQNSPPNCKTAFVQCGIPNGRYPDARPMGYPFDRLPYQVNGVVVPNLEAYQNGLSNVGITQVQITSQN